MSVMKGVKDWKNLTDDEHDKLYLEQRRRVLRGTEMSALARHQRQCLAELYMWRISQNFGCKKCQKEASKYIKSKEWKNDDVFWKTDSE